jgi:superfamily II DNA or RNA helicase
LKVTIDGLLRLQDVPPKVLNRIKVELTIKNPDYIKKKRMGLNRYAWGPEYIKLWSEKVIDEVKTYILPRGFYARLWEITQSIDVYDHTVVLPHIDFPAAPTLREYQLPAIELSQAWISGISIMPCGAGKTETALGIVENIGQPTLWITHTMDLLNQSMQRAKDRLGLTGNQIGVIQGENMSIGSHMTFATVQTLAKRDLTDIANKFGCIVIDECHLVFKDAGKARMFEAVISQFPAKYRFGMTASEFRADGLIDTMFHVIGPKFYEVSQEQLNAAGNVIVPKVEFIETDFIYEPEEDEMLSVAKMICEMREDTHRNNIIKNLLHNIKAFDYCLVLGDSLEHLEMLCEYVSREGKPAAFINGKTPKKQREKIMADMRAGKYQYLFATYQLAKLGLDLPMLNKLVLATPKKDKTSIQQAVGRTMRPMEGKETPVVYDVWDKNIPQLVKWARERIKVYRTLGAEIVGGPKVRK